MADRRTKRMVRLYEKGSSLGDIAQEYGLSRERIRQLITPFTERRPRGAGSGRQQQARMLERGKLRERIDAGKLTVAEAAQNLGVSTWALRNWYSKNGVPLPSRERRDHGTTYRYKQGCRCDECREAIRENRRKMRARGPKVHGRESSYTNYGCRCEACSTAARMERNLRKEKKK